ncbi:hypothetical protein [Halarcobacter sp.]|uniref:hypothetical protein n=1 Tax=Halarcobacter sp. TaxID=2321133 RepID=UPI002AA6C3D8|nr:hypothetical protein [Halarcobacter sp.]
MEMILNENDIVVGAKFDNGTIQDYVDEAKTYGLIRVEDTTANWFLYNDMDSPEEMKAFYKKVKNEEHFIKNDFGEEIVLFNKKGTISFEDLTKKIDSYLDDEVMSSIY